MSWINYYKGGEHGCSHNVIIDGVKYLADETVNNVPKYDHGYIKEEFANPNYVVLRYEYNLCASPTLDDPVYSVSHLQFIISDGHGWFDRDLVIYHCIADGNKYIHGNRYQRYSHLIEGLLNYEADAHNEVYAGLKRKH